MYELSYYFSFGLYIVRLMLYTSFLNFFLLFSYQKDIHFIFLYPIFQTIHNLDLNYTPNQLAIVNVMFKKKIQIKY